MIKSVLDKKINKTWTTIAKISGYLQEQKNVPENFALSNYIWKHFQYWTHLNYIWKHLINLNASLLYKFVQFVLFAGIEVDGRNWDRSRIIRIGIEVWLQESGSKLGYRNRDRNWVTGIGIEIGLQELGSQLVTKLVRSKLRSNWDW